MRWIKFIIGAVIICAALPLTGQDLIKNTRAGILDVNTSETTSRLSEFIQEEQIEHDFEQANPFTIVQSSVMTRHTAYLNDAVYLSLKQSDLQTFYASRASHITLSIPVENRNNIELQLSRVDVTAPDYVLTTSDGRVKDYDRTGGVFYRGIVKGKSNSLAAISVFGNQIRGLISDENGNYVLGELKSERGTYILYNDRELLLEGGFTCEADDELPQPASSSEDIQVNRLLQGDCVNIYIECDSAMYKNHDFDVDNVNAFVTALFNETSTLYANEGITILLSSVFVWTSADPYRPYNNSSDILYAFAQNNPSFNGDLAHFITTRQVGGRAYLYGLCSTGSRYAVTGNMNTTIVPVPTYSWNVMAYAHEMGHNFGSSHTHACVWNGDNTQIDDCGNKYFAEDGSSSTVPPICYDAANEIIPTDGGTIMSYCYLQSVGINLALGFGEQPGDAIRSRYYGATCLVSCDTTCVEDRTISAVFSEGVKDIEAGNSITSTSAVYPGVGLDFDAGTVITLQPGFRAYSGSNFNAFIDGCAGNRMTTSGTRDNSVPEYGSEATYTSWDKEFKLRNYPNPFTGQTNIEFNLPDDTEVSLWITDLTGKQVAVLLNNADKIAGTYTVSFDGHAYPAGMYYYTIQADNYIMTEKMTLVK